MSAFALEDNLRSLWRRRADAKKPVDGLRALSILWVIAYHTFAFIGRPLRHSEHEPLFRLFNRGFLGVDVFFVLSGFLIGGILLREHEATGTIALRRFYARRALRILPAYYVSLAVYCVLIERNARSVWANLLFVNNFLPPERQCMDWAWSLAVEEQFYLVFPLTLLVALPVLRNRLALFGVLMLVGVAIRAWVVHAYAIHIPSPEHSHVFFDTLYDKPYARFPELLSGVIVAYVVGFTRAVEVLRGSPRATALGTVAALALVALVSSAEQPIFRYGWPLSLNFLYYTLSPVLFSLGVGWVLFVCVAELSGGGLLGRVLSWRGFYPVSQLSYTAYLIHMMVIAIGLEIGAFDAARTVGAMCMYIVIIPPIALVASVPLYMLVEKPMMNLRDRTP
jgi:peptidoglycan/LPS O-acetylase OafA/YrhL